MSSTDNFKTVNIKSPTFIDFSVTAGDETLYYIPIRVGKREFSMHAGDASGPVVGVVRLARWRGHIIGIGDPDLEDRTMIWERLDRVGKWTFNEYEFDFGSEPRQSFVWTRTVFRPLKGEFQFVLKKKGETDVIAQYDRKGILKRGDIQRDVKIKEGNGEAWEAIVLLTLMTIIESARRRG